MIHQNDQQAPDNKPRFFYGYIVVAAAFYIMWAIWGIYYAFGVFFKPMSTEFGWSRAMTSGAFSLSSIVRGLLGIVVGGLNDRLGPRIVMTLCGFILGLGYLLMAQVSVVWQFYLFYVVVIGTGMSGSWVPLLSTVARWFTRRRGTMTGIVLAGMSIGTLVAPLLASRLIATYDWRISYIILGILVLIVVVLAAQFLKRDPAQMGQVPYGENREGGQALKLIGDGFLLSEAVYTRQFWILSAIMLCRGFVAFAIIVHIVPHAIDLGIPLISAANILATIGGVSIIGRVAMGSIADRIGYRQAMIIGFILTVAALFWLMPAVEVWKLYLFVIVFGLGEGSMSVLGSPLTAELFGLSSHGLIFGIIAFGYAIGGAVGPFMAGYIFDTTNSYQVAFLISALLAVFGVVLTLLLKPIKTISRQNLEIT